MIVRVCVLVAALVCTSSLAWAQNKPKPDVTPQDAKQIWQDALAELTAAQQAYDDAEVAVKNTDPKDKKLTNERKKASKVAREELKAAQSAADKSFKDVLKTSSLTELAVFYIPTVMKPAWFEKSPNGVFFAKTPGLLTVPTDTWEVGKAFGWDRVNPGGRTIVRGGFGGGLPTNTMLVATTLDEGSGIGIQGKKPRGLFLALNEAEELGEPKPVTPEFRDGGWQFLGTGKGIFLIYNLSDENYK